MCIACRVYVKQRVLNKFLNADLSILLWSMGILASKWAIKWLYW